MLTNLRTVETGPVTLAIVNDYEVVVRGLAQILEPHAEQVRVVELEAGGVPSGPVDVALYDTFANPNGSHADYAKILAGIGAGRLAVYCWNMTSSLVDDALNAGASGYLSKQLGGEEVADALVRIAGGEVVVAGETAGEDRAAFPPGAWPGQDEGLSERESEVLALIAQGMSNDDVADRVFLSINTVKSHIRSAYRKMGVETRAQAILWAVDHGFRQARPAGGRQDDDAL